MLQPIVFAIIFPKVDNFVNIFRLYIFLLTFIFAFFCVGKINLKKVIYYLASALIISSIIACAGHYLNFIDHERLIFNGRFGALTSHPNLLARLCLVTISLLASIILNKNGKILDLLLILLVGVIGYATYSKVYFLLMLAIAGVVVIFSYVKTTNKKRWFKIVGICLLILAILALIAFPYLKGIIKRFFDCDHNISLDSIFTGRIDIWKAFLKEFKSKPVYIIFGKSMMGDLPNPIGIHSTYLALLYQYGIVGLLILFGYLILLFKNFGRFSKSPINYLALVILLVSGFIGDQIFTHYASFMYSFLILSIAKGALTKSQTLNVVSADKQRKAEMAIVKNCLYRFIKRSFDILVSLFAIIILSIPMGIVAVLVKLSSKGPVLFKDKRVGLNGKEILVWKFRSMYVDAESRLEQYLTKEQLEMWKKERKIDNDPRITKIGKIIRKTSLDELPQLFNILKGDLSIIGNRPVSRLEYETYYTEDEKKILNSMRPGLTGYWQVYGRSNVTYATGERQKMCLHYVKKATIWLDIKIFFKTFLVVVTHKGAR